MKKKSFRKLVSLFTLACIMSVFLALPAQAATKAQPSAQAATVSPTAQPSVTPYTSLTSIIHPNDFPVFWTETTNMRQYTNTYFAAWEVSTITTVLQWKFPRLGTLAANVAINYLNWQWATSTNSGYMIVRFYWTPSNDIYSPYYIKQHIDYYYNSNYTGLVASTDNYYYSTTPY